MLTLILLRGAPGSGKSTWIRDNNLEAYTLSADAIRLLIQSPVLTVDGGYTISQRNDNRVWSTLMDLLETRMERGETTVIDATHSSPSMVSKYKRLVDEYRYRCYIVDFSDIPLECCLAQNRMRDPYKFVPEDTIERIHSRILNFNPPKWATLVKPGNFWGTVSREPLDYNKYEKIVLFGDIHDSFTPLENYFRDHPEDENTLYVQLGDLFDRGAECEKVAQWVKEHFNRDNWIFLRSNHNNHLSNWAFDRPVKGNEFLYSTVPQIEKIGDKAFWRGVVRSFWSIAHFRFAGKTWLCSHAGISKMPIDREFPLISMSEFIFGTGRYENLIEVAESWDKNSGDDHYQAFGHRAMENNRDTLWASQRSLFLDGGPDQGGYIKFAHLNKDGSVDTFKYESKVIRKRYQTEQKMIGKTLTNTDFIETMRKHPGIYEKKMGHISSVNFKKKVFYDRSWDEINTVARGLFFNNETGDIIARSYLKFFNWQERNETKNDSLRENLVFPCTAYVKENGFLGLLGYDESQKELVFCTKSSIDNDFSNNFERIFRKNHGDKIDDIEQYLASNSKCMVFEVIDPVNDPHIEEYHEERVVLLDIFERSINIQTVPYWTMKGIAEGFRLSYKQLWYSYNNWDELEKFLNYHSDYREPIMEGFVIEDMTGFQFKLKTGSYNIWKRLRGIIHGMSKGHKIPYNKLIHPLENDFIGWAAKLPREELHASIIHLRNRFFTQKSLDNQGTNS